MCRQVSQTPNLLSRFAQLPKSSELAARRSGRINEADYPISSTSVSGYKYINTEQALEDAVYIARKFDRVSGINETLAPSITPWIWLGGSYSGVRGAQLRVRNPDTFFATWAARAPTQAGVDMWTDYAQAERSMTRNCSASFTAVPRHVDRFLANGTRKRVEALKKQLLTAVRSTSSNAAPIISDADIAEIDDTDVGYLVAAHAAEMVPVVRVKLQHGGVCDVLETRNRADVSTNGERWRVQGSCNKMFPGLPSPSLNTSDYPSECVWRLAHAIIKYDVHHGPVWPVESFIAGVDRRGVAAEKDDAVYSGRWAAGGRY